MIQFFRTQSKSIIAVQAKNAVNAENISKLNWLFSESEYLSAQSIEGWFVGPRKEMITPWSTNAVEITQNMGITGIIRIEEFYKVPEDQFKKVKTNEVLLAQMVKKASGKKVFFANGIPADYIDNSVDLKQYASFDEAYHQLIIDITGLAIDTLQLVVPAKDSTKAIYVSGGFARNEIFVRLLANLLPGKKVYTSEIDNSTALGAALVVGEEAFGKANPQMDLGLKEFMGFAL